MTPAFFLLLHFLGATVMVECPTWECVQRRVVSDQGHGLHSAQVFNQRPALFIGGLSVPAPLVDYNFL